jgi:Holliday junction resolvase RusA-like endonuclease
MENIAEPKKTENMKRQALNLTIPGKPIAKKRPRFARRGKFVTTYNDQETEEGRFLWHVHEQLPVVWKPFDGAVVLTAVFFMPIPKSTSKIKRAQMLQNIIPHTKKPDLDNLVKFIKDCLNGVAWLDDSQVERLVAFKKYSDNPGTEIEVKCG